MSICVNRYENQYIVEQYVWFVFQFSERQLKTDQKGKILEQRCKGTESELDRKQKLQS